MNFIPVDDIHIPELKIYHQLRDNVFSADNSFIADSPKVVNMLLQTDLSIKSILATQEYYDSNRQLLEKREIPKLYIAHKALMQQIVGHRIHHNVMMHGIRPQQVPMEQLGDRIIMLDEISSTQNIGSIARSAAALGIDSYLLPKQGPHPYSRRALRVSMGHISKLKVHLYDTIASTIDTLKSNGYRIYAAEVIPGSTPLSQVNAAEKWVLLMGHEGLGISPEILALCDEVLTIEMAEGIKSFNVGIAASIIMYQLIHKKR
jgi:tRNA G18 (ribose-2'-O)-methylase SpoU